MARLFLILVKIGEFKVKIYIIRHGDPDYSIDSLTEKGWREAEYLSQRLRKLPIDDYYTSPLGRARDTAKPTLEKINKKAIVLDWLREFEGRIISPFTGNERICWDLPPYLWCKEPKYYEFDNWHKTELFDSGNPAEIYSKTIGGIDELLLKYGIRRDGMLYSGRSDKSIALVCHFAMGITVLSYLLGISPVVAQNNFFLPPTSVTTLVTETDSKGFSHFRAVGVGDISHLYAANEPMSLSGLYPDFEE